MANVERGEVDLVVGDKTYTLRMSVNAIVEAQKRTEKTLGDLMRSLQTLDIAALREVIWMMLKKHHGAEFKTPESVGDLIDDAGAQRVVEALEQVFTLNAWQPSGKEGKAAAGGDPHLAQRPTGSTGSASTSAPGASA